MIDATNANYPRLFQSPVSSSSTLLGGCGLVAGGALTDEPNQELLEFLEDLVQTQPAPSTFGSVSLSLVRKSWAAVTSVRCRWKPWYERPSK